MGWWVGWGEGEEEEEERGEEGVLVGGVGWEREGWGGEGGEGRGREGGKGCGGRERRGGGGVGCVVVVCGGGGVGGGVCVCEGGREGRGKGQEGRREGGERGRRGGRRGKHVMVVINFTVNLTAWTTFVCLTSREKTTLDVSWALQPLPLPPLPPPPPVPLPMNIPSSALAQEGTLERDEPRYHDSVWRARSVKQTTLEQSPD